MGILPSCGHVSTAVWLHHLNSNKIIEQKARWQQQKNSTCYLEQLLEAASKKRIALQKTSQWNNPDILSTAGEIRTNSEAMFFNRFIHTDTPVLANQERHNHQLYTDTWCSLEDLQGAMIDRHRWWEIVKELCYQHNLMIYIYIYIYIYILFCNLVFGRDVLFM